MIIQPSNPGYGTAKPGEAPASTFFSIFDVGNTATVRVGGNGDLFPSCWADDGHVYTANGDGHNFGGFAYYDVAVGRVEGAIECGLTGTFLTADLGPPWNGTEEYNRKPTGMACVDSNLYLAVQDLRRDVKPQPYDNAPAATIYMSTDKGKTWTTDNSGPMFGSIDEANPNRFKFTTIMFLDYGRDYENAKDSYVYAYGIDGNWTQAYYRTVPDPTEIFLGRVPCTAILDRNAWEFYCGGSTPIWTQDINQKIPILIDTRRLYKDVVIETHLKDVSVVSQGGVVYNKPLDRYILTSFSGSATTGSITHEFYEAPHPWGPWSFIMSKDYGLPHSWNNHYGGYAPTIPSKYISEDGMTMWLQSNCFYNKQNDYDFSLRQIKVKCHTPKQAENSVDDTANLAVVGTDVMPISKSAHNARLSHINNGDITDTEDDWDGERKPLSWWGYHWTRPYMMNKVVYTTGMMYEDGGWFDRELRLQVRQDFKWIDVSNLRVSPAYPYNNTAGPNLTYIFMFDVIAGDGLRIIGASGGAAAFTSISELEVYYANEKAG